MAAKPLLKPLSEQAIVITGATSGIGLATARKAARAGACVFLIARGEKDLARLTEELQATGARVAHAVADVADFDALSEAAEKCGRLFGGFDTWVNNAGISIFGPIREVSLDDQRRLFETNYWGVVNGSLIAADHLRRRPGGGTIVNVGSTLSDAPVPIQGVYSASKHAVKGFTNAFRMELMRDRAPVAVSLVKPSAIDTPYNRHARNITGQAVQNPQPVYATPVVADTILWCATHPIREITVGGGGRIIASFYAALPGLAEPLFARFAPVLMRDKRGEYRPYEDGLWDPADDGLEEEVHYPMVRGFSTLAEIRKHPGVTAGIVAVLAGIGLGALLLSQRSGPTRYERLRETVRPSRWLERVQPGRRLRDAGHQAYEGWDRLGRASQDLLGRKSRDRAVTLARDPAPEGTAMAAITTIAAAVGAVALKQWQDRR
ncbi:SDR family oxidoreductase [Brevundimonas sp.]|uniref:SDR family oxidoreductase n=1 Tax=Brevundimonas sp. TaxID=1871086 RepID=UPI0026082D7D|nr:SDR family oxidoreductase [Brevundimonas sp.]